MAQQQVAPYTAMCHNYEAEIYRISIFEFKLKVLSNRETLSMINIYSIEKTNHIRELLEKVSNNEMKKAQNVH